MVTVSLGDREPWVGRVVTASLGDREPWVGREVTASLGYREPWVGRVVTASLGDYSEPGGPGATGGRQAPDSSLGTQCLLQEDSTISLAV